MTYREFPAFVPVDGQRMCAVVCVPADERGASDLGVVLLTGVNYTRVHRNGMWVRLARALAGRGFPSIRIDYLGVGDSTGERAIIALNDPFHADASAAVAFLRRAAGVERVAIVSTCFGGHIGMGAAVEDPAVVSFTMFPAPLLVPAGRAAVPFRRKVKHWMRGSSLGERILRRPGVRRVRGAIAERRSAEDEIVSPGFRRNVEAFVGRGGELRFFYGDATPSLPELRRLISELEPSLTPEQRSRIHLEVVPGTELHGFHDVRDQDVVVKLAVESIRRAAGVTADR